MTLRSRKQPVILYACAVELIQLAFAHAQGQGWSVAAAVLDHAGHVVASGRMDGVAPQILEFATDKAHTALLGRSSAEFQARMASEDGLRMGLANRPRLCAWEGGLPVREAGALIGAIGVSGAAGPEVAACARAALHALGLDAV